MWSNKFILLAMLQLDLEYFHNAISGFLKYNVFNVVLSQPCARAGAAGAAAAQLGQSVVTAAMSP